MAVVGARGMGWGLRGRMRRTVGVVESWWSLSPTRSPSWLGGKSEAEDGSMAGAGAAEDGEGRRDRRMETGGFMREGCE